MNTSGLRTHLIGARVGDIDDTCGQLGLQVVDEGGLKGLSLVEDVVLISPTRQSQQEAEVAVPLQRRQRSACSADRSESVRGDRKEDIPSFFGPRSPAEKPRVSSAGQS